MNLRDLINAIGRMKVETGSLVCLGCGYENSCGTRGCAILRKAQQNLQLLSNALSEETVLQFAAEILDTTPEKLRELAQDEKDGRLFAPPVKVGNEAYYIFFDAVPGKHLILGPERITAVGTKGFFLSASLKDPDAVDEFHPYDKLGKEYFLSREEAEAAREKLEDGDECDT